MSAARDRLPSERNVIESLRAGVPSAGVVHTLGSAQNEIEDDFLRLLDGVGRGAPQALVIGGGFGSGKSHLLHHLGLLAREAGYVVSTIVVSKETPLYDPVKVTWAALDGAVLPHRTGLAIEVIADALDPQDPRFGELLVSVGSPSSGLDPRFAATLLLFAKLKHTGDDFLHSIVRFWAGEPLSTPELNKRLRGIDERFAISRVAPTELARQRQRFAARLMVAVGYRGWVVLFDEVELIARYPLVSRAKAYAEIGRWAGGQEQPGTPVATVFALTDDFPAAVLRDKQERERLPARLTAKRTEAGFDLAGRAELGMTAIEDRMRLLTEPDEAELRRTYDLIKRLHGAAFDWSPPDVPGLARSASNRMRQYIRAWINEWDLIWLDSSYQPRSIATHLPQEIMTGRD